MTARWHQGRGRGSQQTTQRPGRNHPV